MKYLLLLFGLCLSVFGLDPNALTLNAIPTTCGGSACLLAQYDMTTITGGTTLVDLSGNGHNGTLHGTTPGTQGITFNGSTDYISIPSLLNGLSQFTVIVICQNSNGASWNETNSGATQNIVRQSTAQNSQIQDNASAGGTLLAPYVPRSNKDFSAYYIQAYGREGRTGVIGQNVATDLDLGVSSLNLITNIASIGAVDTGAQSGFYTGTIAYVLIYGSVLPHGVLTGIYNYLQANVLLSRGLLLPELPNPLGIWQRQGIVLTDASDSPSCLFESSTFKCWYFSGKNIRYRTSLDGQQWSAFTTVLTNIGNSSGRFSPMLHVGSSYIFYADNSTGTAFDRYVCSNETTCAIANTSVIVIGTTGTWNASTLVNPAVNYDGTTYRMIYEGSGSSPYTAFSCGAATSADGISWTIAAGNPISGVGGGGQPCNINYWVPVNGINYMWGEDNVTRIYRRSSATFSSADWILNPVKAVMTGRAPSETQQIASVNDVYANGYVYRFYMAYSTGAVAALKLAVANMPLSQLVLTNEQMNAAFP